MFVTELLLYENQQRDKYNFECRSYQLYKDGTT